MDSIRRRLKQDGIALYSMPRETEQRLILELLINSIHFAVVRIQYLKYVLHTTISNSVAHYPLPLRAPRARRTSHFQKSQVTIIVFHIKQNILMTKSIQAQTITNLVERRGEAII